MYCYLLLNLDTDLIVMVETLLKHKPLSALLAMIYTEYLGNRLSDQAEARDLLVLNRWNVKILWTSLIRRVIRSILYFTAYS